MLRGDYQYYPSRTFASYEEWGRLMYLRLCLSVRKTCGMRGHPVPFPERRRKIGPRALVFLVEEMS